MTDTQIGELLERATDDLRPSTDLVTGGIAAGRRRRRRGLAITAAGTFAAAAVAGAVLTLPGAGSAGDRTLATDPSASTGATGATGAGQPSAPVPSEAEPVNDGPFPVAPASMASTLATLLDGTVTSPSNDAYHLAAPDGWQSGAVDLDGASVSVSYQHSTGPRCDGDLARGNTSCTALGGGFYLGTYQAEIMTAEGRTGVHDIGVTYYTPDGYKISVTAGNASSTDPTRPTMKQALLSLSQLTDLAQDPAWR